MRGRMKISELLSLWENDGYHVTLEFCDHRYDYKYNADTDWFLYVTNFVYQPFEYCRHYGIVIQAKDGEVIRSRILEFQLWGPTLAEMIHQVENIRDMNWENPK